MKFIYSPTYLLKCDCGFSSPASIELDSISSLKAQIVLDYGSEEYSLNDFTIYFDKHTTLTYSWPNRIDIYTKVSGRKIHVLKTSMSISDLIHNLNELVVLEDVI